MISRLYKLFLGSVLTRGRVVGLLALGAVAIVIGLAIGASDTTDKLDDGTFTVAGYGLSLLAPVVTLVFASSVLGDPNEDGTLVYLWLRPIPRSRIAGAAALAAFTVAAPIVVVPMTICAALIGAGPELVGATAASTTLAVAAYTGLFTWLGLRIKRALPWGLAYILIWEGFVARAGGGSATLSVRAHTETVLTRLADGPRRLIESSLTEAIVVPLVAAAIAFVLTVRRLQRQDVA
jgi:ABC-2 type transport system permease protein